ncbi:MAG: hypothetical protein IT535_09520 [Bauldia sp.]|nr:hypothetical protein [Bauldia sp.]
MKSTLRAIAALAAAGVAGIALPAAADNVPFERLLNPEPENWLRDHQNYSNWRHSPLTQITTDNVADLEIKYIFSLGGRATGGTLAGKEEGTILADNGFLYTIDSWHRVQKWDVTSGTAAIPLWRYNPEITKSRTTRGVALLNDGVFVSTNDTRIARLNEATGEVVWEIQAAAPTDPATGTPSPDTQGFTAAPTTLRTAAGRELVLQGESTGGQRGTRSWVGAWDVETGELAWRFFTIPAPGEPGSETWLDDHDAWRVGGAGVWQTPTFDPETNLVIYGTGDAFPSYDPEYRPGDNLFSASTIALNVDTGELGWYFQETPNEQFDFDTPNPRFLYELNGRKVVSDFSRNGHVYTLDRATGEFITAVQYNTQVTWTAGIDPKTGRPVDYNPETGVQKYAGVGPVRGQNVVGEMCPAWGGNPIFFPPAFNPDTRSGYAIGGDGCQYSSTHLQVWREGDVNPIGLGTGLTTVYGDPSEPLTGMIWRYDVDAGTVQMGAQRPGIEPESGMLSTAGNLVFAGWPNGDYAAYDAETLDELWKFNVGMEITAPGSSFSVNGEQLVAVIAGGDGNGLLQRGAVVVVFGLDN